jgi:nucleotide-binding universal stress UspA family protein
MHPDNIRVEVGDPQDKIISVAREEGFDLIILGTHGQGAFESAFLGSVARDVIGKSPVPVLSIKLPPGSPEQNDAYRSPRQAAQN